MTGPAEVTAVRLLGFCAGPHDLDFYACAEHAPLLETNEPTNCFVALKNHPVRAVDEDERESEDCWFCREGGD